MDYELMGRFKTAFKTCHSLMLGMYLIAYLVFFLEAKRLEDLSQAKHFAPSFVIGIIAIIVMFIFSDYLKIKNSKVNNSFMFLYVFVMAGLSMYIQYEFGKVIFIIFVVEILFENSIRISYDEEDRKIVQLVALGSGFSIEFILFFLVRKYSTAEILIGIVLYSLIIVVYAVFMNVQNTIVVFYDEKIFSKARMIDEVNNTNNKLVDNQEKINRANEMLGMQKIKLEAAYNKINRINTEMVILNNIIKTINESKDVKELSELITTSVCKGISMDVCGVVINKDVVANKKPIVVVNCNYSNTFYDVFLNFINNGAFPGDFDETKIIIDNKVDNSQYKELNTNIIGSILMIPLVIEENIVGRLYVGCSKYGYFKDDISFYNSIVAQFLIGIKNIQMFNTLENMAIRDGLTGIYNRRQLNVVERKWIEKMDLNNDKFTSVLLDIDKFKNINDSYGHKTGDVVIKGVANTICESFEDMDDVIVARYGGEEFVALLKNHDFDQICDKVEKLHQRIRECKFSHDGKEISVNVSIGIASYPQTCDNPEVVINRSDWAMYYSKQNGRGRITIDNPAVDALRK